MTRKKKKKTSALKDWKNFNKQKNTKPLPFKIAYPLGKTKNKPIQIKFGDTWLDFKNVKRGLDVVHKEIAPGKAGAAHVLKNLTDHMLTKKINWYVLIIVAETMGVTPAKLFKILTKYFKEEKTSKLKVAMINPALVRLLVRKIESYGGRRKFWNNPRGRAYFNRWCKLTGTPEIKSRSNFEDYVTDWLALSGIGKRNKIKVLQTALGTGGDREFSIFNKPPKS